jgi:hypothetical protein
MDGVVISIGEFCISAKILENLKLKIESYPFDWLFSNIDFICDCIDTDFQIFRDEIKNGKQDFIKSYPDNSFKRIGMPHKDPKNHETIDYYERRITSFNKIVKGNDINKNIKKIFLHVKGEPYNEISNDKLDKLCDSLERVGCDNYEIISIIMSPNNQMENKSFEKMHYTSSKHNINKYVIYTGNLKIDIGNWLLHLGNYVDTMKNILSLHDYEKMTIINTNNL